MRTTTKIEYIISYLLLDNQCMHVLYVNDDSDDEDTR